MAEPFSGARLITTTGYTFAGLNVFVGVKNAHTAAQQVLIAGPRIYNPDGSASWNYAAPPGGNAGLSGGITFQLGVGQQLEVKCNYIKPATGNVLGLYA